MKTIRDLQVGQTGIITNDRLAHRLDKDNWVCYSNIEPFATAYYTELGNIGGALSCALEDWFEESIVATPKEVDAYYQGLVKDIAKSWTSRTSEFLVAPLPILINCTIDKSHSTLCTCDFYTVVLPIGCQCGGK